MFGMGAKLSLSELAGAGRNQRGLLAGLLAQMLWPPVLALGLSIALSLSPAWTMGLFLIALAPGSTLSALYTYLSKGNGALSILLTLLGTVLSIASVPLLLALMTNATTGEVAPLPYAAVFWDTVFYLLAPLVVGMGVCRWLPLRAERISRWSVGFAVVLLVLIGFASLRSGRIELLGYGFGPPMILMTFMALLIASVEIGCRAFLKNDQDALAVAMTAGIRNSGLAMLVSQSVFVGSPELQGQVLYSCHFYAGVSLLVGITFIVRERIIRPRWLRPTRQASGPRVAVLGTASLAGVHGGARNSRSSS